MANPTLQPKLEEHACHPQLEIGSHDITHSDHVPHEYCCKPGLVLHHFPASPTGHGLASSLISVFAFVIQVASSPSIAFYDLQRHLNRVAGYPTVSLSSIEFVTDALKVDPSLRP